jgi:hypothetical protein
MILQGAVGRGCSVKMGIIMTLDDDDVPDCCCGCRFPACTRSRRRRRRSSTCGEICTRAP